MTTILAIIVSLSSLIFVAVILHYISQLMEKEKTLKAKERALLAQAGLVLEEDEEKAQQMLTQTAQRANKMLVEAELVKAQMQSQFAQALQAVITKNAQVLEMQTEKFQQLHAQTLIEAKNEFIAQINKSVEDVAKATEAELEDFMHVLSQETIEAQTLAGKRINESYEKMQKELEEYRKKEMEKIEKDAGKLIAQVAQDILGQTISLHDHEGLVMQALEQAKEKGVITHE